MWSTCCWELCFVALINICIIYIKKHAEEMKIITTALEKEGYGPNQATVDEVIRYLWWKKERNDIELTETKETLAALGGEEPQQAFKVTYQLCTFANYLSH